MSLRKDRTLYTARFRNLKLKAWGFNQVVKESFQVTVYQESCSPARWACRPQLTRQGHSWRGATAEDVMKLVTGDFETQESEWFGYTDPGVAVRKPSLRADSPDTRRSA